MNLFTKRQRDILALLVKEQEPVKVKKIAAIFGVAERTIRYDLKWIQYGLKEKNIELVKVPRFGIKLDCSMTGETHEAILKELNDFCHKVLSTAERQFFILLHLLMKPKEVAMQEVADYLNVSKNTIVSDIEAIDVLLETAGLKIARKAHHGILLAGPEKKLRNFYIKTLLNGLEKEYITEDNLALLLDGISSAPIISAIGEVEAGLKAEFSDLSKKELYIALLIAIYRMDCGKFIETDPTNHGDTPIDFTINTLYQNFASSKEITIPPDEIDYIRQIFMGAQYANNLIEVSPQFRKTDSEVFNICKDMIQDARIYLGVDLDNDLELVNGLTIHLTTAIYRLRNNLSAVLNPLTQQIKFQMPFIYEMSKKIARKYESQIGAVMSDDEIAYIAMYLGAAFERSLSGGFMPTAMVVCGSGTATSGLLITRLKIMLSELRLIGPVPADKIPEILLDHPVDFIITTAPLKVSGKEVILVNPLLDNDDLNKIRTLIFRHTSKKQLQHISKCCILENQSRFTLKDLVPPEAIKLNIECKDWQQSIRICSQSLLEKGAITEKYVNAMIKAVLNYGPYIVFIPEIALAHAAPEMGVNQECLSLATLKKPLYFGDKNQELVKIIVVFGAMDHQLISLHRMIKIFENESNIERIKNALSYEQIMNLSDR